MRTTMVTLPDVAGLDVEDAKQDLRTIVRGRRARRSAYERDQLAAQWVTTAIDFIGSSRTVACYVSVNDEPPTRLILEAAAHAGVRILLPKLGPRLAREWAWYEGEDDLRVYAPGRPPEPSGEAVSAEILANVDAIIMPALLIDRVGHRIGQGGGWYDRVLKQVSSSTRIGAMVYPEEYVNQELPQEDMDRRVPYVLLPDHWEACSLDHTDEAA